MEPTKWFEFLEKLWEDIPALRNVDGVNENHIEQTNLDRNICGFTVAHSMFDINDGWLEVEKQSDVYVYSVWVLGLHIVYLFILSYLLVIPKTNKPSP